jgi:hypothetical protein
LASAVAALRASSLPEACVNAAVEAFFASLDARLANLVLDERAMRRAAKSLSASHDISTACLATAGVGLRLKMAGVEVATWARDRSLPCDPGRALPICSDVANVLLTAHKEAMLNPEERAIVAPRLNLLQIELLVSSFRPDAVTPTVPSPAVVAELNAAVAAASLDLIQSGANLLVPTSVSLPAFCTPISATAWRMALAAPISLPSGLPAETTDELAPFIDSETL